MIPKVEINMFSQYTLSENDLIRDAAYKIGRDTVISADHAEYCLREARKLHITLDAAIPLLRACVNANLSFETVLTAIKDKERKA